MRVCVSVASKDTFGGCSDNLLQAARGFNCFSVSAQWGPNFPSLPFIVNRKLKMENYCISTYPMYVVRLSQKAKVYDFDIFSSLHSPTPVGKIIQKR